MSIDSLEDLVSSLIEDRDTKEWAKTSLPLSPPPFHSIERLEVVSRMEEEEACFNSITHQIESLLAGRRHYATSIAKKRVLLSPIRFLPPELLSRIFVLCGVPTFPFVGCNRNPFAVAAVSRFWRTVAIETPELWTSFQIEDGDEKWAKIEAVRQHLARSGQCPLDIHVHGGKLPTKTYDELLALSGRWRSTVIDGNFQQLARVARFLDRAILLEKLELSWNKRPNHKRHAATKSRDPSLPALITLKKLQQLNMMEVPLNKWPRMVCPGLTSLKFNKLSIPISWWNALCCSSVNLKQVSLMACEFVVDKELFVTASLLNCEEFTIRSGAFTDEPLDRLEEYIVKSMRRLTSLDIGLRKLDLTFPINVSALTSLTLHLCMSFQPPDDEEDDDDDYNEFDRDVVDTFFSSVPVLKELKVSWVSAGHSCRALCVDSIVIALAEDYLVCPKLEILHLADVDVERHSLRYFMESRSAETDDDVVEASNCALSLEGCYNLPDTKPCFYADFEALLSDESVTTNDPYGSNASFQEQIYNAAMEFLNPNVPFAPI